MPETLSLTADAVQFQCRHIRPDGRRCGSPSLRNGNFCYHHDLTRRPGPRQPQVNTAQAAKRNTFPLPTPADLSERTGLQLALAQILGKIANNEIDPRRAGLLLYGLQIASGLLPRSETAPTPGQVVEEVVQDPDLGPLAPETELTEPEPVMTPGGRVLQRWLDELEAEGAADNARKAQEALRAKQADQSGEGSQSNDAAQRHTLTASAPPNRAQRRAQLQSRLRRLHRSVTRSAIPQPPATRI